ncbi:MAG: cysteine hydrolase family protein [Gemmatimonadota bacterium]
MPTPLLFWDVDTQVDFMLPGGKLYVPGSEEIIPALRALTDYAHHTGTRILASADDHDPSDPELSDHPDFVETFPPHCMHGTPGQEKIPETALHEPLTIPPERGNPGILRQLVQSHLGDLLILKRRFDVFSNPNMDAVLRGLDPKAIVLYGVALDVCDRFAIEGLLERRPQTTIYFVTDAARAIRPELVPGLLESWAARGVRMVTTADVVSGALDRDLRPVARDS